MAGRASLYLERCREESIQGQIVTFNDGSSAVVDSIILCTSYKTLFPFIKGCLRIAEEMSFYQSELYKESLFIPFAQSKLFFFIMGLLPNEPKTTEEMQLYADDWHDRVKHFKCVSDLVEFQASFIKDLAGDTKYGREYTKAVPLFLKFLKDEDAGVAHYRDTKFASFLSK
ncbi:hypothetical protein MAR_015650 [Mya arenaria]|uniref:Flavin-containing monooxygenase n=1 Tax=Mya arenaria TaxID=6604 RepID=A0ABY7FL66_MYAAR|nr:hypothetical protein MAR_015650 [Mya arenaria]